MMNRDSYMRREGARAAGAMRMRNEYSKQYGIQNYLIVEGESDEHFFENILDCKKCKVVSLSGKENVLNFIEKENHAKRKGYLAIVDADFDHVIRKETTMDNVVLTDTHDIEMLIIRSNPKLKK